MLDLVLPCLCAILILSCCGLSSAEIIQYSDHAVLPDRPEYLVIPKFDRTEVPHWFPGKGRSFIDLGDLKVGVSTHIHIYDTYDIWHMTYDI
jgi:hypothetical protein